MGYEGALNKFLIIGLIVFLGFALFHGYSNGISGAVTVVPGTDLTFGNIQVTPIVGGTQLNIPVNNLGPGQATFYGRDVLRKLPRVSLRSTRGVLKKSLEAYAA